MEFPLARILSLPHELLQSFLQSVAKFEPWTYGSALQRADASITDEDSLVYTPDARSLNYILRNHHTLGLSSESNWLPLMLSRHPYHLVRGDKARISSAVTQSLRRMNARLERMHWEERVTDAPIRITGVSHTGNTKIKYNNATSLGNLSMEQHHARAQTEEEADADEDSHIAWKSSNSTIYTPNSLTALVVYSPPPVLKLNRLDVMRLICQQDTADPASSQTTALLLVIVATLLQCHIALLSEIDQLCRDIPLPSIEHDDNGEIGRPNTVPLSDRHRSLSGSTVTEIFPHEEVLSFSPVKTVYGSHALRETKTKEQDKEEKPETGRVKEVRFAEKRESEDKDVGKSVKRPKLNEYKQVSSGRVATLMERFEGFHF